MTQLKFKKDGLMARYFTFCWGRNSNPQSFCQLFWGLLFSPLLIPFRGIYFLTLPVISFVEKKWSDNIEANYQRAIVKQIAFYRANPKYMAFDYYSKYNSYSVFYSDSDYHVKAQAMRELGGIQFLIDAGFIVNPEKNGHEGRNVEQLCSVWNKVYDERHAKKNKAFLLQVKAWISNAYEFVVEKTCPLIVWEE